MAAVTAASAPIRLVDSRAPRIFYVNFTYKLCNDGRERALLPYRKRGSASMDESRGAESCQSLPAVRKALEERSVHRRQPQKGLASAFTSPELSSLAPLPSSRVWYAHYNSSSPNGAFFVRVRANERCSLVVDGRARSRSLSEQTDISLAICARARTREKERKRDGKRRERTETDIAGYARHEIFLPSPRRESRTFHANETVDARRRRSALSPSNGKRQSARFVAAPVVALRARI